MPMKQTGRKQYKSMQGKSIDMDLLRQKNELTPAVGNAKVNARGDELGPGGKIVRTREQVYRTTMIQIQECLMKTWLLDNNLLMRKRQKYLIHL